MKKEIKQIFFYTLQLEKERNQPSPDKEKLEFIERARESLILHLAVKEKKRTENLRILKERIKNRIK